MGSANNVGALLDLEVRKAQAAIGTSISGTLLANDLNVDISGRTVDATNTDTSETFSTITLNDGSFIFESLPTGTYTFDVNSALISEQMPMIVEVAPDEAVPARNQGRTGAPIHLVRERMLTSLQTSFSYGLRAEIAATRNAEIPPANNHYVVDKLTESDLSPDGRHVPCHDLSR